MSVLCSGLVLDGLTRGFSSPLRTDTSSSNSCYSAGYCSAESADHASYAGDERGYTLIHMEGIARVDEQRLQLVAGAGHGLLGLSCTAVALDVRLGVLESDAKVLLPTV